ncbi:MAG TPA: hypothetical protein VMC86_02020 [Gemmatimonadales bacterium]|nr:hypothetical protein [Gemmatimonadales bacterium]
MTAHAAERSPIRIPELAPALGRLIVPRRSEPPWIPLDDIADELATAVIELGGEARRLVAEGGDRDAVLAALGRARWLAAWEQAVRRASERVGDHLDDQIERVGRGVRMPRRKRRARKLVGVERRALVARLSAGGSGLVEALDEVDRTAARLQEAPAGDDEAHDLWREAVQTAARRLEAAWLALEEAVLVERKHWEPELAALAAWRPALWPAILAWAVGAAVVIWLGLVLGGWVDAPAWLARRLGF